MPKSLIENFQGLIGYRFRKPEVLLEALTHSSFSRESSGLVRDNEQLEFLGDSVLGFIVSFKLADAFPDLTEGKLSRARSRLVATDHLSEVAAQLDLGRFLRLGRGEERTGGRTNARLAVDALEALVAAIYRDGGVRAARKFITRFILPPDLVGAREQLFTVDYKSALQEYLQGGRLAAATYRVAGEIGPEHCKIFTVEVRAAGCVARGKGASKKLAEQEAARRCLEMVERSYSGDG